MTGASSVVSTQKVLKEFNQPETTRTLKSSASDFHDLQLLLSAVEKLTKVLRTRRCVYFLQIIEHVYSSDNFVLFILLVQRHLSGTVFISDTTKQLPSTSVHKYWLGEKEIHFLGKRLAGDKYSYHYSDTNCHEIITRSPTSYLTVRSH